MNRPTRIIYCLTLFSSLIILWGCSSSAENNQKKVRLDDKSATKVVDGQKVVVINESDLDQKADFASDAAVKQQDGTVKAPDNSEVVTMTDGAGNTIVSRTFHNDPAIMTIVKTTSVKGNVEVEVFAKNRQKKIVPPEMVENIMTASGNEIAKKLNIAPPLYVMPTQPSMAKKQENEVKPPVIAKPIPTVAPQVVEEQPAQTEENAAKPEVAKSQTDTVVKENN